MHGRHKISRISALCVGIASIVGLIVLVLLSLSHYCSPKIVLGRVRFGKTLTLSQNLTKEEELCVRAFLASPDFLLSIRNKCTEDAGLVKIWTTKNVTFKLWRGIDGSVQFDYSAPGYSVEYFSISALTMHHNSQDFPKLNREIQVREQRIDHIILERLIDIVKKCQQRK